MKTIVCLSSFISLIWAESVCPPLKSQFQDYDCCPHSQSSLPAVCWRTGLDLQSIAWKNDAAFMSLGNFYQRGLALLSSAERLFTVGYEESDKTKQLLADAYLLNQNRVEIELNQMPQKRLMDHPSDHEAAAKLVASGKVVINIPTQGLMWVLNASLVTPDMVVSSNTPFGAASIYAPCDDPIKTTMDMTPMSTNSVDYLAHINPTQVVGPVLVAHDGLEVGQSVTYKQLANSKDFLVLQYDTCWCPTCINGIGYPNAFSDNLHGMKEMSKIVEMVGSAQQAVVFSNKNLFTDTILETECGCIIGKSPDEQVDGCKATPNSCATNFLVEKGYPSSMVEMFLGFRMSSVVPGSDGCRVMEVAGQTPGLEDENIVKDLVDGSTDVRFYYNASAKVYVEVEYDSDQFPSGKQSGFMIINVHTGEVVVPHTSNFQLGKNSPGNEFVIYTVFEALGHLELAETYLQGVQLDATPDQRKHVKMDSLYSTKSWTV